MFIQNVNILQRLCSEVFVVWKNFETRSTYSDDVMTVAYSLCTTE